VNAGPTAERVYDTLKQALKDRSFRPGARLDPALLAQNLASSTTPVREALNQLAGEGLVESRTGGGFHLPSLDEPGLKDMYAWSSELLMLALRGWPQPGRDSAPPPSRTVPDGDEESLSGRTERLFAAIGKRSLNCEHGRAIERLGDRLHGVRSCEPQIVDGGSEELDDIAAGLRAADKAALRRCLGAYHRRRIRRAAAILRAFYRGS